MADGTQSKARRGRKTDQVLAGARDVFLAKGFEGATVDDIARAAGVSKATVYSYFTDKRQLFVEMATHQCKLQSDEALHRIDQSLPPALVLKQAGTQFLGFVLSDIGQRIFRICVAESERFPDIGAQFYASGPMVMRAVVAAYLQKCCERGELQITDIALAADQFAEMCKADLWIQMILRVKTNATADEIDRVVTGAVETFLARYGT